MLTSRRIDNTVIEELPLLLKKNVKEKKEEAEYLYARAISGIY